MTEKSAFFQSRAEDYKLKIDELKSRFNRYSFLRTVWFILCLVLAIWMISLNNAVALASVIFIFFVVFIIFVIRHNHVKRDLDLNRKLLEINEEEIQRLQYDFTGMYGGEEFEDDKHPYTADLDIFGRNSLFRLINRAETTLGILKLKNLLSSFASKEEIENRQRMIRELSPQTEWRQKFQAFGRHKKSGDDKSFKQWLIGKDFIGNQIFYKVLPYTMIGFSSLLLLAALQGLISDYLLFVPIFITGYFLHKIRHYSDETYRMTETGVKILGSLEKMLKIVEQHEFTDPNLVKLKNKLFVTGLPASAKINDLRKILELLNLRGNMMYHLFNMFFLLDYIFLTRAEKWREKFGNEIDAWFDTVADFELLSSLAAFSFAQDNYVFPNITDTEFTFVAKGLGHPLIPLKERIENDFEFRGRGGCCVITGSNMAGKSTFLRTVGINAVLAFAGAPVCATSMDISLFLVFSSMRTKDNLEESISSFYAELLRLKMLLEKINEGIPIFYLLDEILKGTNSVDRHLGAESLILQLNELNVFGLVSTHDLALGKLSKKNNLIANYHFSSSIVDEEIVFDYKLQPGICQSTNAAQLMAKIGINIKS